MDPKERERFHTPEEERALTVAQQLLRSMTEAEATESGGAVSTIEGELVCQPLNTLRSPTP